MVRPALKLMALVAPVPPAGMKLTWPVAVGETAATLTATALAVNGTAHGDRRETSGGRRSREATASRECRAAGTERAATKDRPLGVGSPVNVAVTVSGLAGVVIVWEGAPAVRPRRERVLLARAARLRRGRRQQRRSSPTTIAVKGAVTASRLQRRVSPDGLVAKVTFTLRGTRSRLRVASASLGVGGGEDHLEVARRPPLPGPRELAR